MGLLQGLLRGIPGVWTIAHVYVLQSTQRNASAFQGDRGILNGFLNTGSETTKTLTNSQHDHVKLQTFRLQSWNIGRTGRLLALSRG